MTETDLDKKVRDACHRIEELYYETGGKCYVSFSGGKDSTVLLALIKLCEEIYTIPPNAIPAVFSNTGIEMGITVDFVKWVKENWYPNVETIRPTKPFGWVLEHEGKPIKSKQKAKDLHQWHYGKRTEALLLLLLTDGACQTGKFACKHRLGDKDMHMLHDDFPIRPSNKCCDWMKKKPFKEYTDKNGMLGTMQGLRSAEGGARESALNKRLRSGGKPCTWVKGNVINKAPIIDWSDEDVDAFVKQYNVPLSDAYTKYGFDRTGCMACPFGKYVDRDLEYLYYHEHNRYIASMHWLKDVYIAQSVKLPFDEAYERERERMWQEVYEPMRQEMLRKYRPESRRIKDSDQLSLFFDEEGEDDISN